MPDIPAWSVLVEHFHFIRPYFLLLLVVVCWLTWHLYKRTKLSNAWSAVGDPELISYSLVGSGKKTSLAPLFLVFIVGVLLVVALAGPTWSKLPQAVYKKEAARVFVLDLSRSMDATDVLPSRASRAKLKLIDLLNASDEGQVALLVYAAEPHIVSPLTDDADTIIAMIPSLSPSIMPAQGSRADRVIIKAAQLLKQSGNHDGEIVLITDGVNATKANEAAQKISISGYTLNVVGVGTEQGSPIPLQQGGLLKDASGAIVMPKMDRSVLKTLALSGSGIYIDIAVDDSDVSRLITKITSGDLATDNPLIREADLWQDEGHWFLLFALPFAAMGFRRGWLTVVVFSVCYLPADDLYAYEWQDLWQTKDQQARTLLDAGEAEKAAAMFRDNNWKGAALYENGSFEQAAEAFSQSSSIDAMYNRANALAKQGKLEQAIEVYDDVLSQMPEHEDAKFNKDLVENAKNNQKQKPAGDEQQPGDKDSGEKQESEQQNSDSDESESNEDQQQSNPGQSEGSEEDQQKQPPEDGEESNQQEAEQGEDEQKNEETKSQQQKDMKEEEPAELDKEAEQQQEEIRQATQQWLRRIPDDPGGLLREKFSRQYQRQQNRQQTENPW